MAFSPNVWSQLKNLTCDEIIAALEKDGWVREDRRGATLGYIHNSQRRRVVVHYHPKKTYGAKLLKGLLEDIGWTEADLKRLKLVR